VSARQIPTCVADTEANHVSDAVRKKQGEGALFDEIGGIAAQEPSVNKSLCNVEGGCKMDVSV
jgi:hypothetical protein